MPIRTDELSDEEIELRLELLKRQRERGQAPAAAPAGVLRVSSRTKQEIDEKWFRTLKVCPHCTEEKNVGEDFGIVVHRGVQYAASWCKACRSKTSNEYKSKPRKNVSKHNPAPTPAPEKPPRAKRSKK